MAALTMKGGDIFAQLKFTIEAVNLTDAEVVCMKVPGLHIMNYFQAFSRGKP